MTIQEYERCLRMEKDLLSYLRLLKAGLQHYLVIITVADTGAAPYFTPDCAQAMLDLGLKVNMLQRYRQPYIAIIDYGKVVREKVSEDLEKPLIIKGKLNHHDLAIYSAGFMYMHGIGCGAMVMIDGANYHAGGRGFDFFVFDKHQDRIVDTCCFDTYDMGKSGHRNPASEPALRAFHKKYPGVKLCTLILPRGIPKYAKDVTPYEDFIRNKTLENPNWIFELIGRKMTWKSIYDKKEFPYCTDYETFDDFYEAFTAPQSQVDFEGVRRFIEHRSKAVNTQNGIRVTVGQPQHPKRAIFLVGVCTLYGFGATDEYSPASQLQKKLNVHAEGKDFIVYNYSYYVGGADTSIGERLAILRSLPLRKGDIVFFQDSAIWGIPCCELSLKAVRPHNYGEIHTDNGHYTQSGNRMIADGIFEFLEKNNFFEDDLPVDVGTPIRMNRLQLEDEDEQLRDYKGKLENFYQRTISPKIGSIVMNCNPFTVGHRYLVEQALKRCDHLIVFVVEEDKSVFPFAERIELVKKNLSDLKNVSVIPSGQFIISSRTFKEYFNKESLQEHTIDTSLDVTLFGKEIAPCLNISMRFAGEEPFDSVTRQYNASMARILPQYGVKFIEIPRMKYKGKPVSASEVRSLAEAKQFGKLKKLVPPITLRYLYRKVPQ